MHFSHHSDPSILRRKRSSRVLSFFGQFSRNVPGARVSRKAHRGPRSWPPKLHLGRSKRLQHQNILRSNPSAHGLSRLKGILTREASSSTSTFGSIDILENRILKISLRVAKSGAPMYRIRSKRPGRISAESCLSARGTIERQLRLLEHQVGSSRQRL